MTALQEADPAAIVLHGRTKKELSLVPAHWDSIGRARAVVAEHAPHIPFFGNGDVRNVGHGTALAEEYGLDGVMIGRASFGTPWLFHEECVIV